MKRRGFLQTLAGLPVVGVIPAVAREPITEVERAAAKALDMAYDEAMAGADMTMVTRYRHVDYGYAIVREGDRIRIKPVGHG